MAEPLTTESSPSIARLTGEIIEDTQRLMRQEFALARRELLDEWTKTKQAMIMLVMGSGLLAIAVTLLSIMLAEVLDLVLPHWAGFAIVGVAWAILGGILLVIGRGQLRALRLIPQQTVETLRRDVQAIGSVLSTDEPSTRPHWQ